MRALLLHQLPDGVEPRVQDVDESRLPSGDVLIDVAASSLNYKDGLAVTGKGKIVRGNFPFVPGIDLAGRVSASSSDAWAVGDHVILTGWGTGEERWGGYATRARASAEHLVRLPQGLTSFDAMAIGTAGFTAMLSLLALESAGVVPGGLPVVVTGASGGVGSASVALLSEAGFEVHAVSGTEAAHAELLASGASKVLARADVAEPPANPLGPATWAGAIDSVGGSTLATLIATTERRGCVAACGLAGGASLKTTVFPFILRGVTLAGIDSNTAPTPLREQAWARLAAAQQAGTFAHVRRTTIGLADVPEWSDRIVTGSTIGRVVVDVNA